MSRTPEHHPSQRFVEKVHRDYYKMLFPAARHLLDRKFDRTVFGEEHIPDTPAIFTPNHIQLADSPIVAATYTELTGKPMRFLAKREYFDGEGMDGNGKFGRSVRWLMQHTQMIPVDREGTNPREFQYLQGAAGHRLAQGDAVAIHPEGTRSDDGKLHKFKSGAARIALNYSVPIVPVGLVYSEYSNERKTHVDVIFGQPVMPEEFAPLTTLFPAKEMKARRLIQVVEGRVADLTDMPQSGAFAKLRKLRDLGDSDRLE